MGSFPGWELLLGPSGLLVAALIAIGVLWRQLSQEHQARLNDAKSYAETLLRVAESAHRAIDQIEALTRVKLPTPTETGQLSSLNRG